MGFLVGLVQTAQNERYRDERPYISVCFVHMTDLEVIADGADEQMSES